MTSIERTAYPRFGRVLTARELEALSPSPEDIVWARERSRGGEHLLGLLVALKCLRPRQIAHSASALADARRYPVPPRRTTPGNRGGGGEEPSAGALDDQLRHPVAAREVPQPLKEHAGVHLRPKPSGDHVVLRVNRLLDVVEPGGKSRFDELKRSAGRASWSNFREQVAYLRWVDSLGDAAGWVEGIAESKVADFAGEAAAADAAVMRDVSQPKRTALLACLVHVAQARARDELVEMFCKRMAVITKRAKAELETLREEGRSISDG